MTLREYINNILFEDNANAYAISLDNQLLSKIKENQNSLSQVSYIDFNKKRILQSIKTKDMILNYSSATTFANDVFNKLKNKYSTSYYKKLINQAAIDYYNRFKTLNY